jgi:hypothetical protein
LEQGIVGHVTSTGDFRIAMDVDLDQLISDPLLTILVLIVHPAKESGDRITVP